MNERRKSELSRVSNESHLEEHIISIEELCKRLNTDPEKGLSANVAKRVLDVNGPNIVTTNTRSEEWPRFVNNLFDWFNCFLWIGSFLCFTTYITEKLTSIEPVLLDDLYLGCTLGGVVLISGSFSYYQEAKSANIFIAFQDLIPRTVTVIRGGSKLVCSASELVVGDLIEMNAGDRVPADIRIIASHQFKCVNPLLTGDSEPFVRTEECSHLNPFKTNNLVFFSTNCVEGSAKGIVIRTGDKTLMSNLLVKFYIEKPKKKYSESELDQNINRFIRDITIVSMLFGVLMSGISYLVGYTWLNAIIFAIALIVAQIPEGLFPTLTVVLSLAAKRMTSKNCLIKNLETVETIGLTSIIITDKTGVITQNRMIVSHIWANNSIIDSDNFYRHLDGKKADLDSPVWRALIRASCLCNRAVFSARQTRLSPVRRKAVGNATEIAILVYMEIIVGCVENYRQNYPKVFEIPFDPNLRYSLTINKSRGGFWLCMKGSPEIIIQKCSSILTMGKVHPFDEKLKTHLTDVLEQLGNFGERVIAFCDKFLPFDDFPIGYEFDSELENYPSNELRFIGLLSLMNPPRPSVPDAVMKCRSAGIKIIMMTGDHPITSKGIARAVGIISEEHQTAQEISDRLAIDINDVDQNSVKASVVTGDQIEEMSDQQINELVHSQRDVVLAQMTPIQKLRVVQCSQREQSLIAVTGVDTHSSAKDNFSQNINIAMGMTGTDMSKQSADIILLDDNFASIVIGIEEGRVIFDNLRKSICYTLSSKTPEVVPFMLYIIFDIPLALGSISILCIDLVTDIIPAISLAYELPESDIMKNKPRDPFTNRLVNMRLLGLSYTIFGIIQLLSALFTYVVIMTENGFFAQHLLGIRKQWDSKAINDLMDSYGQEWTYRRRKTLEYTCQTAFFAAVVITKWSALICCKTRRVSLIKQKMKNDVLTFSLFFELGIAVFLSYCPGLDEGINMFPLKFFWWFCSTPFALLMILIDEMRRFIIRHNPKGWVETNSYY